MPLPADVTVARKVIKVPVTTIDVYAGRNNIDKVDFIKIDVEGGELAVLKGGRNVLNKCRPIVMCELADTRTRQWGYLANEIYRFLADFVFLWFRLNPEGLLKPAQIKEKYDPDWENLIAVPREKLNLIENFREG
jgi:hypothetical protein